MALIRWWFLNRKRCRARLEIFSVKPVLHRPTPPLESRPFLLRKDKGYWGTLREAEGNISSHDLRHRRARDSFLDDSANPNIIFHPRCVSVDAAAFDILDLASVHPLPAGPGFLSLQFLPLLFYLRLSFYVFSFLPSMSLKAPLFHPPSNSSRLDSVPFTPCSYLDLPSSRISPFSCTYIYLCSSSPWIKLHPGGRTSTLVDELPIGRMWCAHVLLASSTTIVPPFIVQLTAQFCISHRYALFIVSNFSLCHLILVISITILANYFCIFL